MGARGEHHAADIYPAWKKAIASAGESITIFTPYFDALIEQLIKKAPVDVTVVTDLSPQSGAQDYLGQLRAIKKLLAEGIEVRQLDRLHAKVLWVDDGQVIYGSQNFTRYARKSKEASTSPAADLTGSTFTDTLAAWLRESSPVEAEFVDMLLAQTHDPAAQLAAAQTDILTSYDNTVREYQRVLAERREAEKRAHAQRMSPSTFDRLTQHVRQPQGLAHLRREHQLKAGQHDYGWYLSMVAGKNENLERWIASDPDGTRRVIALSRARMYPTLFADTGTMAFVRVMRTRITYVGFGVSVSDKPLVLSPSPHFPYLHFARADVEVECHDNPRKKTNLRFIFNVKAPFHGIYETVTFDARFTGDDFIVHGIKQSTLQPPTGQPDPTITTPRAAVRRALIDDLFSSAQAREAFFADYLAHFKYKKVGIEYPNVEDAFTEPFYELGVTEYARTPVLLAREDPGGWIWG